MLGSMDGLSSVRVKRPSDDGIAAAVRRSVEALNGPVRARRAIERTTCYLRHRDQCRWGMSFALNTRARQHRVTSMT